MTLDLAMIDWWRTLLFYLAGVGWCLGVALSRIGADDSADLVGLAFLASAVWPFTALIYAGYYTGSLSRRAAGSGEGKA